ncbi:unnamed protein product [Prorocentrum cordatum]|uniref:Uncharacterized protein n=1 Tax=Prorocentrum cordatum TaxID=2364126 RepID=A0ABN9UUH7_9DINO|nr:unnamed protein product [Polarella glacialis]
MALARCGNENALYIGSGRRGAHCHAGEELAKPTRGFSEGARAPKNPAAL